MKIKRGSCIHQRICQDILDRIPIGGSATRGGFINFHIIRIFNAVDDLKVHSTPFHFNLKLAMF